MDRRVSETYLSTRYVDARRDLLIERRYHESGDVVVVRNGEPELVCRFDERQIAAAKLAVRESGIDAIADVPAGGRHDTATMSYRWRLGAVRGEVVDHAYPEVVPAAFDDLEARLTELEEAARSR